MRTKSRDHCQNPGLAFSASAGVFRLKAGAVVRVWAVEIVGRLSMKSHWCLIQTEDPPCQKDREPLPGTS